MALKLEPLIAAKAKANLSAGGGDRKSPSPKSAKAVSEPINTREQLAKTAGLSHDTIAKAKLIAEHADEATKERLRKNDISIHRVAKEIKETRQREERQAKRQEAAKTAPKKDSRIIIGDAGQPWQTAGTRVILSARL